MTVKKDKTVVQTVDVNMDELFAMPGAESIMTPEDGNPKPQNVFTNPNPDTTFLDKPNLGDPNPAEPADPAPQDPPADPPADPPVDPKDDPQDPPADPADPVDPNDDPLALPDPNADPVEGDEKSKGGRPTVMVSATKKLIEKGLITPFVDKDGKEEALDTYTEEDYVQLYESNVNKIKADLKKDLPAEFFGEMPVEMQQAYQYLHEGGKDIKGMFTALAASTEMKNIDITQETGQKQAVRNYLQATDWGTPEEIEDEIFSLQDKGQLEKKSQQFKPKLDAMRQKIVDKKIADQTVATKQRQEASQKYIDNVYNTLEKGKLGDLELDSKTQNMLYAGLVQSNYPSISGKQTNMLGHLLEKYQWVEPNHGLIAEALWLLSDPEGYKGQLSTKVEKIVNQRTLKTLKTEAQSKDSAPANPEPAAPAATKRTRAGVQRPQQNFFARS